MNRDQLVGAIAATLGQYLASIGVKVDAASCIIAADGILSQIQAVQSSSRPQASQPQTSQQLLDLAGTVQQLRAELAALKAGATTAAPQTAPSQTGPGGA